MKSGLEGRNNRHKPHGTRPTGVRVSMKSGLEGRNNAAIWESAAELVGVSMKSGLEGRNNRGA